MEEALKTLSLCRVGKWHAAVSSPWEQSFPEGRLQEEDRVLLAFSTPSGVGAFGGVRWGPWAWLPASSSQKLSEVEVPPLLMCFGF